MAKMGMMKWAIGAAAGAAAVAGQTVRDPPAFMDRVTDGLSASYTFQQSDCANGEIPADFGTVGPLTMTSADTSANMCPLAQVGDKLLFGAHNGVSLNGLRGADTLQTVESAAGATAQLSLGNEFSLEFWIKPDFSQEISDANEYVLFELGSAAPSDNSVNRLCGIDYDLKVSMRGSSGEIDVETNLGDRCVELSFRQDEDVVAGQVYHLVLSGAITEVLDADGIVEENVLTGFLYVNGEENDDDDDDGDPGFSFSSWNSDNILSIGSSPAVASTNPFLIADTAWSGDILMFSMYDRALSEAEAAQNYNAWLSNSSPFVAGTSASVSGAKEDESGEIDLSSIALYDFDTSAVFSGTEPTSFNSIALVSSYKFVEGTQAIQGTFSASEGGEALNAGDDFEQLFFLPTTSNAYGDDTCVVDVVVSDTFQSSSESVVLFMYVEPTNDGLTCDDVELVGDAGVPQSKTSIVELTASDLDCASDADLVNGPDGTSPCETLGVDAFVLDQPMYGAFFKNADCTEIIAAEEYPFEFAATAPDTAGDKYTASVCWQSCFGTSGDVPCPEGASVGDDGVLAIEQIAVTAVSGTFTSPANVTIQVNSALSVTITQTEMFEDSRTEITFSGSDAICDDVSPVPEICASRLRSFQIVALPPASTGTLIDASDEPIVEGQVVENGQVFFLAAQNYFNRDSFPLCGVDSFTTCPDGLVSSCTGPESMPSVCEASDTDASRYTSFTTSFLGGKIMGGCDATPEVGCPVEVTVALVIDGERSPPKVGNAIWVTNLNDDIALQTKVAPELINTNVMTPFEDASGEQLITISDSYDSNSRVLELTISASDNVLLASTAGAALVSFPECNPTVAASNCNSVVAHGTLDGLNAQIALMTYSTADLSGEVEINVTVTDVAASLRSSTVVDVAGAPQEVSASIATFSFEMAVATLSPTVSPTASPTGAPTPESDTKSLLMIVVPSTLGGIILLLGVGLYVTSRKSSNTAAMQPASSSARKASFQV